MYARPNCTFPRFYYSAVVSLSWPQPAPTHRLVMEMVVGVRATMPAAARAAVVLKEAVAAMVRVVGWQLAEQVLQAVVRAAAVVEQAAVAAAHQAVVA
jgi:hypothetical protein